MTKLVALNEIFDIKLDVNKWKTFIVSDLFKITSSNDPLVSELDLGSTPYIASTKSNNGVIQYVNLPPTNPKNVLTVNRGGSVGEAFYQNQPFLATQVDVRILIPKFEINRYIGMFLSTILRKEKYRFNYTRKMGTARLEKSQIKLPATHEGKPDWQFMENYIKSLPYTKNLDSVKGI